MLTVSQAADQLNVSRDAVTRAIVSGRLAAFDHATGPRHCYRIPQEAIEAYKARIAVKPPPPPQRKKKPLAIKGRWFD